MTRRLILYDLDGTLIDARPDIEAADRDVMARLGARAPAAEAERLFAAYWAEHAFERSLLYPGARALLDHFHPRRQALLTSRPEQSCRELLRVLDVASYFTDVVAGDSPYPPKPDPAGAKAILQRAGISAQEALLIGDSPCDIEAGRLAGMLTVAVSHGMHSADALQAAAPDVLAEDLIQVLRLAQDHGW